MWFWCFHIMICNVMSDWLRRKITSYYTFYLIIIISNFYLWFNIVINLQWIRVCLVTKQNSLNPRLTLCSLSCSHWVCLNWPLHGLPFRIPALGSPACPWCPGRCPVSKCSVRCEVSSWQDVLAPPGHREELCGPSPSHLLQSGPISTNTRQKFPARRG